MNYIIHRKYYLSDDPDKIDFFHKKMNEARNNVSNIIFKKSSKC